MLRTVAGAGRQYRLFIYRARAPRGWRRGKKSESKSQSNQQMLPDSSSVAPESGFFVYPWMRRSRAQIRKMVKSLPSHVD